MAEIIRVDGSVEALELPQREPFRKIREVIGGWVEIVNISNLGDPAMRLLVDEEGLLKGKELNTFATLMYRGVPPRHDGVIVGDVVLARVYNPGQDDERWE